MSTGPKTGVLLLQLGTPDAPTPGALRRYLHQFLLDRRVIDLPRALWWPILYLSVLPRRPARSARLYKKVWTNEGSPLATISQGQATALAKKFDRDHPGQIHVALGMRYGRPSIASATDELLEAGCDRILALPMYPQYASATTGSSVECLFAHLSTLRVVPAVRIVPPYYEAPEYIEALASVSRKALGDWGADHVVISFHGLPKRYAELGDPYPEQCKATGRALIAAMGWPEDRVTVAFQSLFGREEWLRPYTDQMLLQLAGKKIGKLAALCPGFTADCLETLEEMGMTNRELYQHAGGGDYRMLPCLNTEPAWIDAMSRIVERELQGWI